MATTIKPGVQEDGSWCVPTFKVSQLQHRVEVLNRRVKKTGGAGLGLAALREEVRELPLLDGELVPRVESWTFVSITGDVPRVDGWDFVARVEHHVGLGNIVSRAPGCDVELLSTWRVEGPSCDHCNAKRIRKDTFILLRGHEFKRVGRNCLADFLRGGSPEEALRLWSVLASVRSLLSEASEEGFGGSGGGKRGFGTVGFLACTVSSIRHGGWLSKAACNGTDKVPTAVTASWLADKAPSQQSARERWVAMQPTEADFEEAGEVVAWAQAIEESKLNDYLSNLQVAVSIGCVERRHEGIVASGVAARRRDIEKALEAARTSSRPPGQFVGVVGKRYDFRGLTVKSARSVGSDFGTSVLLIMEDPAGNEIKTFYRGDSTYKAGDVLGGKATVKAHDEYRGAKQTVLIRCKLETGLPVQGSLPIPSVSEAAPKEAPAFSDEEIPF